MDRLKKEQLVATGMLALYCGLAASVVLIVVMLLY